MHTNPSGQPEARTRRHEKQPHGENAVATIARAAQRVGFQLTNAQTDLLMRHAEMLHSASATVNLTSVRTTDAIVAKLVAPSIQLLAPAGGWLPTAEWWAGRSVIDIGSGAGFPGIPMAILLPECNFTLLEARAKKCHFMRDAIEQLGISNASVVNSRAETAGQKQAYRERYDVAVARAVAPLPELAELVLPFVCVGGTALLPKGGSDAELQSEVKTASKAIDTLGSAPAVVMDDNSGADAASGEERIVYLMKIAPTPDRYPRNTGIPRKRPIS